MVGSKKISEGGMSQTLQIETQQESLIICSGLAKICAGVTILCRQNEQFTEQFSAKFVDILVDFLRFGTYNVFWQKRGKALFPEVHVLLGRTHESLSILEWIVKKEGFL